MESFVSFDNKYLILENPLPPITFEDLHKLAKVRLRKRRMADRLVFDLDIRWGGGEDFKSHTLRPGQRIQMPERIGREIADAYRPSGEICGTSPGLAVYASEDDREQKIIEALAVAETHYHTVGAYQIDGVRSAMGHRDEDVQRFRDSTYSTYFLAQAKEREIRKLRQKIEEHGIEALSHAA